MNQALNWHLVLPSSEWLRTLDTLLSAANSEARTRGFETVLERSDRSEARYLHVRRDRNWFGIRIATHIPFYSCSRDYAQIITSPAPHSSEQRFFARLIRERVAQGGKVVANPTLIHEYFGMSSQTFRSLDNRRQAQLRHRANRIAAWGVQLVR
jgi:hypothetical protein